MIPILFIHGFGGGAYEFQPIIRYLKKHGYDKFYEFTYEKKHGEVSLRDIAQELAAFVEKQVTEQGFHIIGVSQGGIIARYYLQNFNTKIVPKCVTLCTPHEGSLMGYLGKKPGFIDLRPGSDLLRELEKNEHKVSLTLFYGIYTPFDLMVFPGWFAHNKFANESKMVLAPVHPLAFWWPSTLRFIREVLARR
jgi:triacylglycerol lipase